MMSRLLTSVLSDAAMLHDNLSSANLLANG